MILTSDHIPAGLSRKVKRLSRPMQNAEATAAVSLLKRGKDVDSGAVLGVSQELLLETLDL